MIGDGGIAVRGSDPHRGDASRSPKRASPLIGNIKKAALGAHEDDESLDELRKTVEKLLLPLVEDDEENEDSEDFIESLKLDLFPKDVYAFTPMGKVIQLPRGCDTDRFCLRDPLAGRRHLHRGKDQRPDRAAQDRAAKRRRR